MLIKSREAVLQVDLSSEITDIPFKTSMNLNIDSVKEQTFDAIVVGSGVSGGWAAKELTEKGLRVLMLERGQQLEHVTGYESATKDPWQLQYAGRSTMAQRDAFPQKNRSTPINETNEAYWMANQDAFYEEDKPFNWYRPNIVGGKSIMWGRQSYRFSDIDFEGNAKEGVAIDWPIRYKDIAPWYSHVEKFAGISGEKLNLPQLPDSEFLPPMEMYCVEKEVRKRIEKNFPGRNMTIGRVANLSKAGEAQLGVGSCSVSVPQQMCAWVAPMGLISARSRVPCPRRPKPVG